MKTQHRSDSMLREKRTTMYVAVVPTGLIKSKMLRSSVVYMADNRYVYLEYNRKPSRAQIVRDMQGWGDPKTIAKRNIRLFAQTTTIQKTKGRNANENFNQ